jgi:hypothetical protein
MPMTIEELEIIIKANVKDAIKGIRQVRDEIDKAAKHSANPLRKIAEASRQISTSATPSLKKLSGAMFRFGKTTKMATAQQQLLGDKIGDIRATLAAEAEGPGLLNKRETLELRAELEKLEKQYDKLSGATKKTSGSFEKSFKKARKASKRFVLSLLSIRSAFALISRGMRNYLATNDKARSQYEVTANVLGQVLAPAMKVLLDIVQFTVIGLSMLIKMFTGVDFLAKATTKNIKKAADGAKKLNKELAPFDEIVNLSEQDNGIDLSSDIDALEEFNRKVAKVQELFEKWNISKVVDKLKDLAHWLGENKELVGLLALSFAAFKVGSFLTGIAAAIGVTGTGAAATAGATGLAGLAGILMWVAGIAATGILIAITVKGIGKAISEFNSLKESISKESDRIKQNAKTVQGFIERGRDSGLTSEQEKIRRRTLNQALKRAQQQIQSLEKEKTLFGIFGTNKKISKDQDILRKEIQDIKRELGSAGGGFSFANGGVVSKPTAGLMGEYSDASTNPEIIAPQSIIRETLAQALSEVGSNDDRPIILKVNGQEFAQATFGDFENERNRLGQSTTVRRVS